MLEHVRAVCPGAFQPQPVHTYFVTMLSRRFNTSILGDSLIATEKATRTAHSLPDALLQQQGIRSPVQQMRRPLTRPPSLAAGPCTLVLLLGAS